MDMFGDGSVCEDINECEENVCDQVCTNMHGSFMCSCNYGYESYFNPDTNRTECLDVDECTDHGTNYAAKNRCSDNASCTNNDGSYSCECNAGYEDLGAHSEWGLFMSGVNCADIDECSMENDCHHTAICTNEPGDYTCECENSGDPNTGKFIKKFLRPIRSDKGFPKRNGSLLTQLFEFGK